MPTKGTATNKGVGGSPGAGRPTVVPYKFGVRRPQAYGDNKWVPVNPFITMAPKPPALKAGEELIKSAMPDKLMPEALRWANARQRRVDRKV